jgi:hypothetical protein
MKKLDVSGVSNSAQMKLKSGTLQFLQDANAEAFAILCQALIGSSYSASQIYILWGCVNTGSGDNYIISAGGVFYNGEIYLVDAVSFTLNANVAIFSPITTQYQVNADPMTFSDSSVHNIHNIRKMLVAAGISGTIDYSSAKGILEFIPKQLNLTAQGANISGTYPDLKVIVPANSNRYPAIYAGTLNIGDNMNGTGGTDYSISFADLGTANYLVCGTIRSNSTSSRFNEDISVTWGVRGLTSAGFILRIRDLAANWLQDISFDYIIFAI